VEIKKSIESIQKCIAKHLNQLNRLTKCESWWTIRGNESLHYPFVFKWIGTLKNSRNFGARIFIYIYPI